MISFDEAYAHVMGNTRDFGLETVELLSSTGKILGEAVHADRDFPPFDRVVKDGIAIAHSAYAGGIREFGIAGIAAAGAPRGELPSPGQCLEVMTGAILPKNTDTVVMYENLRIRDGKAMILEPPLKGQEIHRQGSDLREGERLLSSGIRIGPAEIGVLATVGMARVTVRRTPKVSVVSNGDELVAIESVPLPHQIRRSNVYTLQAALAQDGISTAPFHLSDDPATLHKGLEQVFSASEVVLISGGVSKGKYDHIPNVLDSLGVVRQFHRVAQRPGKPFWFGTHPTRGTVVFSFPGNPISTWVCYCVYFLPWLQASLGQAVSSWNVVLNEDIAVTGTLTRFVQVDLKEHQGIITATPIAENGSGDLVSLTRSVGWVRLAPRQQAYRKGEPVPFHPSRKSIF